MSQPENPSAFPVNTAIINQPWEDVASDVTAAIEIAVQPLIKRAADDIYAGMLDTTQDYLRDNIAFNIASRIDTAEREARDARQINAVLLEALEELIPANLCAANLALPDDAVLPVDMTLGEIRRALAAIAKAKGGAA